MCAALHADALGHGFFVALGPRFMRAYLDGYRRSPHAAALVAAVDGHPVGMIVGILRPGAHMRWLLRRRGLRLAWLGVTAMALRPRVAARFVRTRLQRYGRGWRRRRGPEEAPATTTPAVDPAVLSHVAVAAGARGAGIGRDLVQAFVAEARAAGVPSVILATLAADEGASTFYERLGWQRRNAFATADGTHMVQFRLELSK